MQITCPSQTNPLSPPFSLVLHAPYNAFRYPLSIIISLCTNVPTGPTKKAGPITDPALSV